MNRRDLFKFLSGIGLGAVAIETYERLYHIPMIEIMFRKELEYWINQYSSAREEVERLTGKLREREGEISSLRSDLTKSKEELEHLIQQYNTTKEEANRLSEMLRQSVEEINSLKEKTNYWEAQYNTAREEVGRLNSIINKIDELERESTSAIEYYKGRMDEAIRKLKEIIERYRVLLGDERVSFEYSTVKILEDLKLTQEKLQKVLPYFPLILNFAWKPTKVVNDKIYDIKVIFEVISPLSSLEEVEVMLIPVEYRYFITDYGMREEDYDKVFPEEEVRIVKIRPRNLEREIFSVDFEDLKGGREYIIKARVKDVARNEKRVAVKTPYIRQFENIGRELYEKGVIVMANYYPFYPNPHSWEALEPMAVHPLLGKYDVTDDIVINKHIDWTTGFGINTFIFSWPIHWGSDSVMVLRNIDKIVSVSGNQIHFTFQVEGIDTAIEWNPNVQRDGWKLILKDKSDWEVILTGDTYVNSITKLKPYMRHENYFKLGDRPFIFLFNTARLYGNVEEFYDTLRGTLDNTYIMCNYVDTWAASSTYTKDGSGGWLLKCEESGNCDLIRVANSADANTVWVAGWYTPIKEPLEDYYPKYIEEAYSIWSKLANKYGWSFVPSVVPGFINLRDNFPEELPRSKQLFKEILDSSFRHAYSPSKKTKILKIDTFNEFGEATGIEPTREEGFSFLEALRDYLYSI